MAAVGEAEASNAGEQLARNSLPETHPDDEPGAASSGRSRFLFIRFSHRTVRSPYALKHSAEGLAGFPLSSIPRLAFQTRPATGNPAPNVDA